MQNEKKSITLYIGQNPFKLSVNPSQEELYRKAERRINAYMQQLADKNNISDRMLQMGYALINFAIKETYYVDRQQYVDTKLKDNLKTLQDVLRRTLDGLEGDR
ncbi:MAG: cell division protein ZapA [Bacteroidales bacterium]|nr:cell division protein ZapA [Bacteroidales bacterium]